MQELCAQTHKLKHAHTDLHPYTNIYECIYIRGPQYVVE